MPKTNKRSVGSDKEQMAADYLQDKGYEIIERNRYTPFGEIDIIAKKQDTLVFAEIKYRSTLRCGDPLEAVDFRKQKRISKAALYYYSFHGDNLKCRFDVIAIYGDNSITHVENAFEYCG